MGVAEVVARACQNLDIEAWPACGIHQFLTQLLAKVIDTVNILKQPCDLQGEGMLSFLLAKGSPGNENLLALEDGVADTKSKASARSKRKIFPETWHLTDLD